MTTDPPTNEPQRVRFTRGNDRAKKIVALDDYRNQPDQVNWLNQTYAVVLAGNKAVILREGVVDELTGRLTWSLMPVSAFHTWLANKRITIQDKPTPISKLWMVSDQRRQYEGLEFAPGGARDTIYNLWKGFSVKPKPGDCSLFLEHIRSNICSGNEGHYDWVIGWCAQIVQQPDQKMGTSLVLIGGEGTGKSVFGTVIGSLFQDHYMPVSDPRYITGRFNSHMVQCLLLHAEEAFWAGDKTAEGRVKDMVTGEIHLVEFKGIEPFPVRNYIRLLVTTNSDWAVPAGMGARRFTVLRVSDAHQKDIPYFAAIMEQVENGGREALLHYLLNFDLSKVDLRTVPRTEALLEQQIHSLTAEQGWWLDVLKAGKLPARREIDGRAFSTSDIFDAYINHANKVGVRHRSIGVEIGMFLKTIIGPKLQKKRNCTFSHAAEGAGDHTKTGAGYIFPTLETCREAFDRHLKQEQEWDDRRYWD